MCGRFSLTKGDQDLEEEFGARVPRAYRRRYNIAPTQEVLVLLYENGERRLESMRWGLVPSWADDPKIGRRLINARAETLFEKPSFKGAARERRCLVLADGFYEWQDRNGTRIPFYVRLKSGRPFGFAGLWEAWTAPEGETMKTCAIVTTEANTLLSSIHPRMPVIVPKDLEGIWLDAKIRDGPALDRVLQPYLPEGMEAYPVSMLVNAPENDLPECVEPACR